MSSYNMEPSSLLIFENLIKVPSKPNAAETSVVHDLLYNQHVSRKLLDLVCSYADPEHGDGRRDKHPADCCIIARFPTFNDTSQLNNEQSCVCSNTDCL